MRFSVLASLGLLATLATAARTGSHSRSSSSSGTHLYGNINNVDIRTLSASEFYPRTKRGAWLIEFYSPYCPHCKKFAPIWQEVTEAYADLENTHDFHMARVNCIASGDLCNAQTINGYPQIMLYSNGLIVDEYDGDRDFDSLAAYVSDEAAAWKLFKESDLGKDF